MAINSYGYPTSITPGSIYAHIAQAMGKVYSVEGFDDFRVTAAGSGTRRVNISAGWAMGKGVLVQNTANATLDLAAPAGTSQWFLVGLKRWVDNPNYPATEPDTPYLTEIVSVAGTTSRAVPVVPQIPGDDDTQWLALCRVSSSATLVQEVVDLRLISGEGGGGYQVFSDLALQQLDGSIGARVYRGDTTGGHVPQFYERISSTAGVLSWQRVGEYRNYVPTFNTGSVTLMDAYWRSDGEDVIVEVEARLDGMPSNFTMSLPVTGRSHIGYTRPFGLAVVRQGDASGSNVEVGAIVNAGDGLMTEVTIVTTESNPRTWGPGIPVTWTAENGAELGMSLRYRRA